MKKIFVLFSLSLILSGCSTAYDRHGRYYQGPGEHIGAALGGLIDALVSGGMEAPLDQQIQYGLESGRSGVPYNWNDPSTGYRYSITPRSSFHKNHRPCRSYTMSIRAHGSMQTVSATACRQPDGTWQNIDNTPYSNSTSRYRRAQVPQGVGPNQCRYRDDAGRLIIVNCKR